MRKQNLFSGIRATSAPHIGNYLGAIRQFIALQNSHNCLFGVMDLHTLTTPFEPKELRKNTLEAAADYLALGLDPEKCALFLQSQVAEHVELAWIFQCITPLGELNKMTQFKEKSEEFKKESANSGLLNYPVLMAADILVYKSEVVPVGEDQIQHIELARTIARKFNHQFGKTFPEPQQILAKGSRIKSLSDPTKKMSKSVGHAILITDSPEEILKKMRKAVTATDSRGKSAGVENLFVLLREFGNKQQIQYFENGYENNTIKFSELKDTLAKEIADHFAPFRAKRAELIANPEKIAEILADGAKRAKAIAQETMTEVKKRVGLL